MPHDNEHKLARSHDNEEKHDNTTAKSTTKTNITN